MGACGLFVGLCMCEVGGCGLCGVSAGVFFVCFFWGCSSIGDRRGRRGFFWFF